LRTTLIYRVAEIYLCIQQRDHRDWTGTDDCIYVSQLYTRGHGS
jgi:hypothetical protein